MNRGTVLLLAAVVIIILGCAYWLFSSFFTAPKTETPVAGTQTTEQSLMPTKPVEPASASVMASLTPSATSTKKGAPSGTVLKSLTP